MTTIDLRRWPLGLAALTLSAALAACSSASAGAPDVGQTGGPPPATQAPASDAPATAVPTPSDAGSDAMPITVDLATANDADVSIDIVDRTGTLVSAASGTPGDGTSVAAYDVVVENIDPQRLRLTWSDFPHDNRLSMWIDEVDGKLRMAIVQPPPVGPTDAMGLDRVLELTFDHDVQATDVETILQDGIDTPA